MHSRSRATSKPMLALSLALVLGASSAILAQEKPRTDGDEASRAPQASSPSPDSPGVLTGKERLGKKWMDEQRVDNCKIPLDKRGTKPRPDSCAPRAAD